MEQNGFDRKREMMLRECFAVLHIERTKDEDIIRAAYRRLLVDVNPEDDPEGFKRLRSAYETALEYAASADEDGIIRSGKMLQPDTPEGEFFREFSDIYDSIHRRTDPDEWRRLLSFPVLESLDEGDRVKWNLFSRLSDQFRLPCRIWQLLDDAFSIRDNRKEFEEHLPREFVDYMIYKIEDKDGRSDFPPYEMLEGSDGADFDGFIGELVQYIRELQEAQEAETSAPKQRANGGDCRKRREKLEHIALYEVYHPWLSLEQAKLLFDSGSTDEALDIVKRLLAEYPPDKYPSECRIRLEGAALLYRAGALEEAAAIYRSITDNADDNAAGMFTALCRLSGIEAGNHNWNEARTLATRARRIHSTQELTDLLDEIHPKVIEECLASADTLTDDDAKALLWSFIRTDRWQDGLGFLAEHSGYIKDTAEWHRILSTLHLMAGHNTPAKNEAVLWRRSLQQEGVEDKAHQEALSYEIEGKAFEAEYAQEQNDDKLYADALECFNRCIELCPDDIDYHMDKVLLLRKHEDYEAMADACKKVLEVNGNFFWGYYYLQEAYDELGMAQAVIDTFYQAKGIYDKVPEIYERAVNVFIAYNQYKDAQQLLKQAEDAGVESYQLMLYRISVLDNLAADVESWTAADNYAAHVIQIMKEQKAPDKLLSTAYLNRAYLNEDTERSGDKKTLELACKYAKESERIYDNLSALYFLGRFYERYKNNSTAAYKYLKLCEEKGMDFEWMYFYIARCMEGFKKWDNAIVYYKKVVEKNPDNRDTYWRIAWLYRRKYQRTLVNDYGELALHYLSIQEEKFGVNAITLKQKAIIHCRTREYDTALAEVDEALKSFEDSWLWQIKAEALRGLGRFEEAAGCYVNSILAEDQYGGDSEFSIGRIYSSYVRIKEYDKCIECLQNLLEELDDDEARRACMVRLSCAYALTADYEKSMQCLEDAYESIDISKRRLKKLDDEAERVKKIFGIYQSFMPIDEMQKVIGEKCRAASKMALSAAADEKEPAMGRAVMLHYMGDIYYNLADFKTALRFYEQAYYLSHSIKGYSEAEELACSMMKTFYWLGDSVNARKFGGIYLRHLKRPFRECQELGMSEKEAMELDSPQSKQVFYNLFIYAFYTGRMKDAGRYFDKMKSSRMCHWCCEEDCTEYYEICALMAMQRKDYKKARDYCRLSNETSWSGDNIEARMFLMMMDKIMTGKADYSGCAP